MKKGAAMQVWPGHPYPLGATGVELCLFNMIDTKQETTKIALQERTRW